MPPDNPGPSRHELEAKLKQLRDSPATTAGTQDKDLIPLYTALMSVKSESNGTLHWFCSRADQVTRDLAIFLLRLHAYRNATIQEWRTRLSEVWKGCADCIRSMDEAKSTSRTTYFGAFSDTIITNFWSDFANFEVRTIVEELTAANITPESGKSLADVSAPLFYHILSKPAALSNPFILGLISSQPFLPRAIDWPMEPPSPGYLLLVVHEDKEVRDWAVRDVAKCKAMPREHFDSNYELLLHILLKRASEKAGQDEFNNLGSLSSVARSIDSAYPFTEHQSDLWFGFKSVLHLIPVELYETFGVHRAITSHLHDTAPHFREVLRCMLLVMRRMGGKLWSDGDNDYPRVVFDAIKDNPSYIDLILTLDTQKEEPWFLYFFLEYFKSIWAMRIFGDILARFAAFTFDELQHDRFGGKRPIVMAIALQIVSATLTRANKLKSQSHRQSILDVVDIHFDMLVAVSLSKEYDEAQWTNARSQALSVIKNLLSKDVDQAVKAVSELSALSAPFTSDLVRNLAPSMRRQVWWKIYVNVTGKADLGISMLVELAARSAKLEKLSKKTVSRPIWRLYDGNKAPPPEDLLEAVDAAVEAVNTSLTITRDGFLDAVTKFANCNTSTVLRTSIRQHDLAKYLIPLMISPVEDLHVSVQTLIGQAYDVDVRVDCFREILKAAPESSFIGLYNYIADFNSFAPSVTEACNVSKALVRCLTDVLDVLGGSPTALLKDADYVKKNTTEAFSLKTELPKLWKAMTTSIAVVFKQTPKWAAYFDKKAMAEWMRDALIFARDLLEQRRTFEAASLGIPDVDIMGSPSETSSIGRQMVEDLQGVLSELQAWLRLTDTELLYQAFALLRSLFDCFRTVGVKPSSEALAKLSNFIERNRSSDDDSQRTSFLNKADLAELELAIAIFMEPEKDEVEILSISRRRKGKRKSSDRFSSPEIEEVEGPVVRKKLKTDKPRASDAAKVVSKSKKQTKLPFPDKSTRLKLPQKPPLDEPIVRRVSTKAGRRGPKFEGSYRSQSGTSASGASATSSSSSSGSESESSDEDSLAYIKKPEKQPTPKKLKIRPKVQPIRSERPKAILIEDPKAVQARLEAQERLKRHEEARRAAMRLKPDISSLHLAILSWNYDHGGEEPPMKLPELSYVPDSFNDHEHYLRIFQPLLMLEAWAQIIKSKEETTPEVLRVEIKSRSVITPWLDLETMLVTDPAADWRLSPETDIVLLRHITEKRCIMAKVTNSRKGNDGRVVSLRCCTRALERDPGLSIGSTWQLHLVFSLTTLHREYAALMALPYYDMYHAILRPRLSDPVTTSPPEVERTMRAYGVNEPQAKAIISSMNTNGFSLIQGPPGTGKTWTICGLVGAFLSSRRSAPTRIQAPGSAARIRQSAAAKKLLICAPSNAAVDEIAKRLIKGVNGSDGQPLIPKVVRVGAESQINASVKEVSLDFLVDARMSANGGNASGDANAELKSLREQIDTIKATRQLKEEEMQKTVNNTSRVLQLENEISALNTKRIALTQQLDRVRDRMKSQNRSNEATRRRYRSEVLADADVICSTLSGAGHEQLESFDFSMVIIDEASQSIELSSLIPLKYQCARCVMVGDPQQLPPTVLSPEASKWGYNQSLFVRLQKHRPEAVHLLSIQYRMHPEISLLPSKIFYDGRLRDGPDMDKKTAQPWHSDPRFGPYRFYSVERGREEADGNGHSLRNHNEAMMIRACFDGLRKRFPAVDFDYRVGIVSMYRYQIRDLREMFRKQYGREILTKVDFSTVDGFQGQEKDIIILSCVRAGPSLSNIGFLSDVRRMNVAITRSKSSLFIFGHAPSLQRSDRVWRDIIEDARSRSCFAELRDGSYFLSNSVIPSKPSDPPRTGNKGKSLIERIGDGPVERTKPSQDEPEFFSPKKSPKKGPAARKLPRGVKVIGSASVNGSSSTQSNEPPQSEQKSPPNAQQDQGPQPNGQTSKEDVGESSTPAASNHNVPEGGSRPPNVNGKKPAQPSARTQKELEAFLRRKKEASNPFLKR